MKRLLCSILAAACSFSLIIPASAAQFEENIGMDQNVKTIPYTTNEYDAYIALQATPVTVLEESGYTTQDISKLQNTSFEELLYARAQLPEDELYKLGYEREQVQLLKEYDGTPIAENPQMRGVFADLNGEFDVISYSTTKIKVKFSWEWSNAPVLDGAAITDIVTCGFAGTNTGNIQNTMTVATQDTNCRVYYYQGNEDDGYTYVSSKRPDVSIKDVHKHVEAKFQMSETFAINGEYVMGWAQSGYLTVGIKEEATVNELYSGTFAFGYGHTVFTVSPSIDVVPGTGGGATVGLSFGLGTEAMFYKTMIVKSSDGSFKEYNGE